MTSNYSIPLLSNETYNNQESAFYSHSLNMKTRKLGIFRKSPRPSLLIKRAALGNLKTSFHCTHWHHFFPLKKEFFRIPPSPFSQRESFSKTYPSFLTVKEGSTSHPDPLSSGAREKTALLGARNRYAIRLAGHQSPRHVLRDGTAWGINNDGKATSQLQRRHYSITSLLKSLVVSLL